METRYAAMALAPWFPIEEGMGQWLDSTESPQHAWLHCKNGLWMVGAFVNCDQSFSGSNFCALLSDALSATGNPFLEELVSALPSFDPEEHRNWEEAVFTLANSYSNAGRTDPIATVLYRMGGSALFIEGESEGTPAHVAEFFHRVDELSWSHLPEGNQSKAQVSFRLALADTMRRLIPEPTFNNWIERKNGGPLPF